MLRFCRNNLYKHIAFRYNLSAIGSKYYSNKLIIPKSDQTEDVAITFSSEKQERMKYMGSHFTVTNDKESSLKTQKRRELANLYISKNPNRFGIRGNEKNKLLSNDNWSPLDAYIPWKDEFIKAEAERCLQCVDAPCTSGCPASLDIKSFIQCVSSDNWYGAAKIILSDNPLGLSCGQLCDTDSLCKSVCILQNNSFTHNGIEIGQLQQFAVNKLKEQEPYIPQIRDPKWKHITFEKEKICLIGYGSATISCATYLSRLGYKNIDILEKEKKTFYNGTGGGVLKSEISPLRHNKSNIDWEIQQLFDINPNINIIYGQCIDLNDINQLKKTLIDDMGYDAVFIGAGNQHISGPKNIISIGDNEKIFNSKTFLNAVNCDDIQFPKLNGHVLVCGIGDVALDCAVSAYRCGAEQVSVGFRRNFSDIRCSEPLFRDGILGEKCDILPNIQPIAAEIDPNTNKVKVTVQRMFGDYIDEKHFDSERDKLFDYKKYDNSNFIIECDYLITAFGQGLNENEMKTSDTINSNIFFEWLFGGGDFINQSKKKSDENQSVVVAVNDGKVAAWKMHKYLRMKNGEKENKILPNELPSYYTEIDLIDISVELQTNDIELPCIKFPNPYGLASSPPTTSYPMIERAFDLGWGFAVTKTFVLDKDIPTNITPRIYNINKKIDGGNGPLSFGNIELISEKTANYWCNGSHKLKEKYPSKILIASIMAGFDLNDWSELIKLCGEQGIFDAIELNLSCPHGMPDVGMGTAIGHSSELSKQVTIHCVNEAKQYKLPIFVKETIETNEIEFIKSMIESNVYGITAINTIPGINDCKEPKGIPYPNVGKKDLTAPGGVSGNLIRPFATKVIANMNKYLFDNYGIGKHINIMGCGGVNNGQNALQLIRYGADVIQICSAIMESDFNIIYDLETGMKMNLYLNNKKQLSDGIRNSLVEHIEHVTDMDIEAIKIANVNEDLCINCGKCYMSCNDTGYQAIDWNKKTRIPNVIQDACSGCGLCVAVCPIDDAIIMIKKENDSVHTVDRGTFKQEIVTKWN
eukprot:147759_1